jgi:hypothetical protein
MQAADNGMCRTSADVTNQRLIVKAFVLIVALTATALSAQVPGQEGPELTTTLLLGAESGKPLLSLLRPEDQILQVEKLIIPGATSGPPPGQTRFEAMTKASDIVAVIKVINVTGRLNAAGDWIVSTVHGAVETLFKNTSRIALSEGATTSFERAGGEIEVGHQMIRAVTSGWNPYLPGESYLVFGTAKDQTFHVGELSAYFIDGETLVPQSGLAPRGEKHDRAEAFAEIRRSAH